MQHLPLFPLRTVLFPHTTIPLHIFEERYRLMISRCIEERSPFGVVLIRSGEEVGGPAEPHDVGTSARIARVQRLPDGTMNIIAYGVQRFRILALDSSEPYLQGDIELLESEDADSNECPAAAARVAALFGEHQRLVLAISGQWARRLDLPGAADGLADFVAGNMELPPEEKQALLEMLSLPARQSRIAELLGERIRALNQMWEEEQQKTLSARLN